MSLLLQYWKLNRLTTISSVRQYKQASFRAGEIELSVATTHQIDVSLGPLGTTESFS